MKLSQARSLALRITTYHRIHVPAKRDDRLVHTTAGVIAGVGFALSTVGVKQMFFGDAKPAKKILS